MNNYEDFIYYLIATNYFHLELMYCSEIFFLNTWKLNFLPIPIRLAIFEELVTELNGSRAV